MLIGGDHTRTKSVVTSRVSALSAFTKKKETCLGCKSVLSASQNDDALCSYCKPNELSLYMSQLGKYRALENQFSQLWSQCQRCQGSLHEEVICTRLVLSWFYISIDLILVSYMDLYKIDV